MRLDISLDKNEPAHYLAGTLTGTTLTSGERCITCTMLSVALWSLFRSVLMRATEIIALNVASSTEDGTNATAEILANIAHNAEPTPEEEREKNRLAIVC